jgi:3alpha(or 20beta)-hydroxysteroid dehydrogenase
MNRLDGKVAIITGGARGQGAAEAELFVAAGAQVVITDVLDDEGAATAARLGDACAFIHHDVSSEEDWTRVIDTAVKRHGQLDVLVNNAGIFRPATMADTTFDMWQTMLAVNQTGVFLGMRTAAPAMKANGSGSIINISSIAGLGAAAMAHAYSATKWAVRGMSKSAAVELASAGIRVNSVHPGIIATDMLDEFGADARQRLEQRIPMGRVAEADEVGRLVLFLASDDSSYCTGHEFVIDGGMTS